MYKVLIADDETPIRDWLEICVNSTGCECEVVAKASNGRVALEQYREKCPDMIITDIRMPFMDGIDFISQVRKQDVKIPVVILTSYTEFSYARQALQQGVTEYILKTEVTVERMKELLERIIRKLERESPGSGRNHYQLERRRNRFLQLCIEEKRTWSREELEEELKYMDLNLDEGDMAAIAFRDINGNVIIAEQPQGLKIMSVFPYRSDLSLVLCSLSSKAGRHRQHEALYRAAAYALKRTGDSVGISGIYTGCACLPIIFREAVERMDQGFYDTRPLVHDRENVREEADEKDVVMAFEQEVEAAARAGNEEECQEKLLAFIRDMGKRRYPDIGLIREICAGMLKYYCYSFAPEGEKKLSCMEQIKTRVENSRTLAEIELAAIQNIRQIEEMKEKQQEKFSPPVQRAIGYVKENYQSGLTLPVVASQVGFSPDYFSRIFKEETGINFSAYLTGYRLQKAMELLKDTNMKVYEVSIAVGYSNMSYFSTVFKKEYGINPFDFKNSTRQKQEEVMSSLKTKK